MSDLDNCKHALAYLEECDRVAGGGTYFVEIAALIRAYMKMMEDPAVGGEEKAPVDTLTSQQKAGVLRSAKRRDGVPILASIPLKASEPVDPELEALRQMIKETDQKS
jgi:hypothetical protein